VAVLLALALAAAPTDVAAPRPVATSASATARVEIIRLEPVAPPPPGEPALLRQVDRERRQVEFY
jgi:hypothetical protein